MKTIEQFQKAFNQKAAYIKYFQVGNAKLKRDIVARKGKFRKPEIRQAGNVIFTSNEAHIVRNIELLHNIIRDAGLAGFQIDTSAGDAL